MIEVILCVELENSHVLFKSLTGCILVSGGRLYYLSNLIILYFLSLSSAS